MNAHEMKALETQRKQLAAEVQAIEERLSMVKQELSLKQGKLADVNKRIAAAKAPDKKILVSEHAMLRYLERVRGIDLAEVERAILTDSVKTMAKSLGNGTFPVSGFKVKIKDNTVITVLE